MRCHAAGMPRTLTEQPSTSAPVLRTVTRKLAVAPGCTSTTDWSSTMASACWGRLPDAWAVRDGRTRWGGRAVRPG